jgi:hypothetical protein
LDIRAWQIHKSMASVPAPAAEPVPIAVSDAYLKLQKIARKLRKRDPALSEASSFAAAYSDPQYRELVEQDRAFHFAKADSGPSSSTGSVVAFQMLCQAIAAAHPELSPAQVRRWAKLTQEHRDPATAALVGHPI